MRRWQADLILIAIAAIWGLAFVYQKTAMEHVGPQVFIAARSAIAALALAPLAWLEWRRTARAGLPATGLRSIALAAGLLFYLGAALQQTGLITATVTNTGFLTGLYVVITPVLAWLVLRQRPPWLVWLAIALAFIGTWLLGGGTIGGFTSGDWLVVAGALFWAAHLLAVSWSGRLARPITFTALQFVVVAVLGLVGMAALGEPVDTVRLATALPEILYVGLLSSAATFTLLAIAMRHTPAAEATVLVSLETLFAAFCAALLLGERLAPIGWIGALLMFAATLVVQLGPALRARPAPSPAADPR